MLGHALDRHAWDDASGIVRALDAYWDTRGLGQEAAAWADRILAATTGPGQTPSTPAGSLWLYTTIAPGHPAEGRRAAGPGRANLPAGSRLPAGPARNRVDPRKHLRPLPPARHDRPGPRAAGRGRRLVPAKPSQIREELGNACPAWRATYHQLGMTAQRRGRLDEADDWYRKALTISEELGNRPGMAITYGQLGNTAYDRGRLDEAGDWYRKALTIFEELGDRPRMASTYHQLGMTAQDRGRLDEADDWYRKALTISEELGDRPHMASHLPPARHDRPGPRAAGRGRRLVPQIPHHQGRTRQQARHGAHLRAAGPARRGKGPAPAGTGVEHPVRDLVRPVPPAR